MSTVSEQHSALEAQPAATGGAPAWLGIPLRQWLKIVVYGLLLINFGYYVAEDLRVAGHTANAQWAVLDWTMAFATSLDETAWFLLLFLFELETYLLDDESFTRGRVLAMHGLRLLCFAFIAHTVYAYVDYLYVLADAEPVPAASLCDFLGRDVSFARNLVYSELDAVNCRQLSSASQFFLFEDGAVITDAAGMRVERELAWVDVIEAVTWLVIVLLIELLVRLQERGIAGGALLRSAIALKVAAYGLLWCAALYWAYRGHWLYVWDETLWILGFVAIDMNLAEWRGEISADQ